MINNKGNLWKSRNHLSMPYVLETQKDLFNSINKSIWQLFICGQYFVVLKYILKKPTVSFAIHLDTLFIVSFVKAIRFGGVQLIDTLLLFIYFKVQYSWQKEENKNVNTNFKNVNQSNQNSIWCDKKLKIHEKEQALVYIAFELVNVVFQSQRHFHHFFPLVLSWFAFTDAQIVLLMCCRSLNQCIH